MHLREIDQAFWRKYQAIKSGDVLAVARCYGDSQSSQVAAGTSRKKPNVNPSVPVNTTAPRPLGSKNRQPWLLKKNPKHFTLQLTASRDQKAIVGYMRNNKLGKQAAFYRYRRDGNTWFGVIYGSYPTRREAEIVAARLKQTSGLSNPWIRSFAAIQKLIKE